MEKSFQINFYFSVTPLIDVITWFHKLLSLYSYTGGKTKCNSEARCDLKYFKLSVGEKCVMLLFTLLWMTGEKTFMQLWERNRETEGQK